MDITLSNINTLLVIHTFEVLLHIMKVNKKIKFTRRKKIKSNTSLSQNINTDYA